MRSYDRLKRMLDVTTASVGLVVLSPVMVGVAAAVAVKHGRPVLFRQPRPGKDGRVFELLKFRSMLEVDESRGLIAAKDRLTPFGRALRASSLDELPSLLNVIRGDMSVVGPRPLLVKYLPLYTSEQALRHEVRPGITGLAQASGRNALSWDEKLALDVEYVERRSLALDARIVLKTLASVVRRTGINSSGDVTMPEFRGTNGP